MKKIIAVICEYNLFHRGHARQLEKLREMHPDCTILSLMSGNWVQRGECAVLPKYLRARAAVTAGADLVLELPYPWSAGSAEYFARGGVELLMGLGGVDALCFGSESGDGVQLARAAEQTLSEEYRAALQEARRTMAGNESDIQLRQRVYREVYGAELPVRANDILGVEYLRAMKMAGAAFGVSVVHRTGEESATASRAACRAADWTALAEIVSAVLMDFYRNQAPSPQYTLGEAMLAMLRLSDPDRLAQFDGGSGGLSHRLVRCAGEAGSAEEFYSLCATKKYTNAKIRRTVLHALLETTTGQLQRPPLFTTLLAANRRGLDALDRLNGGAAILTKPAHGKRLTGEAAGQLNRSRRADALAALAWGLPGDHEMRCTPWIEQ